jgi:hypothetical protein
MSSAIGNHCSCMYCIVFVGVSIASGMTIVTILLQCRPLTMNTKDKRLISTSRRCVINLVGVHTFSRSCHLGPSYTDGVLGSVDSSYVKALACRVGRHMACPQGVGPQDVKLALS